MLQMCSLNAQGFKPLMSAHRVQDLARMYSLLARVGGTDALRDEWRQYITTTGTAIVKDEANVSADCSRHARIQTNLVAHMHMATGTMVRSLLLTPPPPSPVPFRLACSGLACVLCLTIYRWFLFNLRDHDLTLQDKEMVERLLQLFLFNPAS
jgi:hypothetical protein